MTERLAALSRSKKTGRETKSQDTNSSPRRSIQVQEKQSKFQESNSNPRKPISASTTYRVKTPLLISLLPCLPPSLVVFRDHPMSPHTQLALGDAIPGYFPQEGRGGREGGREGGSDDLEVGTVNGSALLVEEGVSLVGGEREVLALGREGGREGGRMRGGVLHVPAVNFLKRWEGVRDRGMEWYLPTLKHIHPVALNKRTKHGKEGGRNGERSDGGGEEGMASSLLTLRVHAVPRGESSVIPQACSTSTPWPSTKARSIEGGQAAPPTTVRFIVRKPCLLFWLM